MKFNIYLVVLALSGLIAAPAFANCEDDWVSNGRHSYTVLAECNKILNANVDGTAYITLTSANVCIVKDVFRRTFGSSKTLLVSGRTEAFVTSSPTTSISGGASSSARIREPMPGTMTTRTNYLGYVEEATYDSDSKTLKIQDKKNSGEYEVNTILGCE